MKVIIITVFLAAFLVFSLSSRSEAPISEEQAKSLAGTFLKQQKIDWGQPVRVQRHEGFCNLITKIGVKSHAETLTVCYFVYYPTHPTEIKMLGEKAVVLSLDGSKIGVAMRD